MKQQIRARGHAKLETEHLTKKESNKEVPSQAGGSQKMVKIDLFEDENRNKNSHFYEQIARGKE